MSPSSPARSAAGHLSLLSSHPPTPPPPRRQPQLTLPCVVHGSAGCFQLDHAKGIAGLESILGSLATEHQVQRKLEKCSRSQREVSYLFVHPLCSVTSSWGLQECCSATLNWRREEKYLHLYHSFLRLLGTNTKAVGDALRPPTSV